jgi:hypothetical protein
MSTTATPSAGRLDISTIVEGLVSIGNRIYGDDGEEFEPESLIDCERQVFAVLFAPVWRVLTDDSRAKARAIFLYDDGAFDRMLADMERRAPGEVDSSMLGMTFAEARAVVGTVEGE